MTLLHFRVQSGDKVLSEHLKSAGGNATYTSKTIQNELTEICGDIVHDKILAKIRQARYFFILLMRPLIYQMMNSCPLAFDTLMMGNH